jgi:hypothetical protein
VRQGISGPGHGGAGVQAGFGRGRVFPGFRTLPQLAGGLVGWAGTRRER